MAVRQSGARGATRAKKPPQKVGLNEIGSYEKVLEAFKSYDADMNGTMSFKELHSLMVDLNKGRWTEAESDRLFEQIDKNHNGVIDINELVDFIFKKDPIGMGTIGNAGKSDYELVIQEFRKFDTNRNGTLDKSEFTRLMGNLKPGAWDKQRTDAVFTIVDVDKSGEVDMNELVAFLFGVPKSRVKAAGKGAGAGQECLVLVEFRCGPGAPEVMVKQVAGVWRKHFGHEVMVKMVVDKETHGISYVAARDGQVVFWDGPKMVAYRENPFLTLGSMRTWLDDMTRRHIPRLLEGTKAIAAMHQH